MRVTRTVEMRPVRASGYKSCYDGIQLTFGEDTPEGQARIEIDMGENMAKDFLKIMRQIIKEYDEEEVDSE